MRQEAHGEAARADTGIVGRLREQGSDEVESRQHACVDAEAGMKVVAAGVIAQLRAVVDARRFSQHAAADLDARVGAAYRPNADRGKQVQSTRGGELRRNPDGVPHGLNAVSAQDAAAEASGETPTQRDLRVARTRANRFARASQPRSDSRRLRENRCQGRRERSS